MTYVQIAHVPVHRYKKEPIHHKECARVVLRCLFYTLVNHISFVHSSRRVVRLQDLFKRKRYEVLAKDVLNMHFT